MNRIAVMGIVGNSVFLPVDHFHTGGETIEAKNLHTELGGKGFNQAIAAARYGAEVSFFSAVGADAYDTVTAFLKDEGITPVLVIKEEKTAFAAIITDRYGNNRVTVYQGAQLVPDDAELFSDAIRSSDLVLMTNETDEAINRTVLRMAKEAGKPVILNPAPARSYCDEILRDVDLFTPNMHECAGLEGKNRIVTLGADGCYISSLNMNIPALNMGIVKDTTGAGDTFNGVLAAMLAAGASLETAAREANAAAAVSVTENYAVSSIPTRETVEKRKTNRKETEDEILTGKTGLSS